MPPASGARNAARQRAPPQGLEHPAFLCRLRRFLFLRTVRMFCWALALFSVGDSKAECPLGMCDCECATAQSCSDLKTEACYNECCCHFRQQFETVCEACYCTPFYHVNQGGNAHGFAGSDAKNVSHCHAMAAQTDQCANSGEFISFQPGSPGICVCATAPNADCSSRNTSIPSWCAPPSAHSRHALVQDRGKAAPMVRA